MLTKDQAITATREAAFPDPATAGTDKPRWIVHSMAGSLGADWDLEDVITFIEAATEVRWADKATGGLGEVLAAATGHHLLVLSQGRAIAFEVPLPDPHTGFATGPIIVPA